MARKLHAVAQSGVGIRIAHDPGDPLITSHCPFCGSGQVVGRSDGTIECDFCGQNYIVRVQPAFPGAPQAPMGPGAPSDIGPDGGVLPPDAIGPDGLPMDGAEMPPGEDVEGEGGEMPPFGDDGEDGEDEAAEGESGPPEGEEEPPPPPPPPSKGKGKKKAALHPPDGHRFVALDGHTLMGERQFIRHLAATLSGGHPQVLARLREEAAR
jgi:hypothetical protein